MSWVYPQAVVNNIFWEDSPSGYGILPALQLGDSEFVYTPNAFIANSLDLDMGQFCGECHLRARRGTGMNNTASLEVIFYDDIFIPQNMEQWTIDLTATPNWTDFNYTPSFSWRYVRLEGVSFGVEVAVSVLRGDGVGAISRRLLTGVGL